MKVIIAALGVCFVMVQDGAAAERAKSPAEATVFVRLVGSVHTEVEEAGLKQTSDLDRVEIGTGSGFVISPYGYVLTNDHVVRNSELVVSDGFRKAKVTLKVSRIEVCFPPEALTTPGLSSPCSEASVYASDPTLDLAVLFISASNLPYVALGDSDVVRAGQPVDALGYPFGRQLEVGKGATAPDLVPEISTTPGAISALRAGDGGERRYLQISNNLNPGNSGGPLIDRDGFAVGVIRMKLATGAGIGFAIPVNEVKDFLESHGIDHLMPVRRLRLGPFQDVEAKRMRLRLTEGLADTSPFRSRVETDAQAVDVALRIDRVLSPWSPKQIEQTLVGTQAFERLSTSASESQISSRLGDAPLLLGHATGAATDSNRETSMAYGILDLGAEKLVARYVGPAEAMAFNESVLRESLASLAGQRFLVADVGPVEKLEWSPAAVRDGQRALPIPMGWVVEPGAPSPCPGLAPPNTVAAAFPAHDFTLALRAAVWSTGDVTPDQAASACSARGGSLGGASYASRGEWLGVSYSIEGAFTRVGPRQLMQLEVLAPDQRSAFARSLLVAWIKKATE
jgi:S1-C subfamily serine protease